MTFAKRLKQLRKERKLSQDDLSRILNINRSTLAGYETENKEPNFETVISIADFFEVTLDYLFGRTDERTEFKSNINAVSSEIKAYHMIEADGLPKAAIKQVDEYVELVKLKYKSSV